MVGSFKAFLPPVKTGVERARKGRLRREITDLVIIKIMQQTRIFRFVSILGCLVVPATFLRAQSIYETPYTFTTVAGVESYGSDDGSVAEARFNHPMDVATDSQGNLYVADANNHIVRKISVTGEVTTLAGSPGSKGSADGTGSGARFNNPSGIAVDGAGNVYVADTGNHTIRLITPSGVVSLLAGSAGTAGVADGRGGSAQFSSPQGVTADASGNVFVADTGNHAIRRVTPDGTVTTFAGLAGHMGGSDGVGSAAGFSFPRGIVADKSGNLFVADIGNSVIRKITPDATVSTFVGRVQVAAWVDGTGSAALFYAPLGLAIDGSGNIYVTDKFSFAVRIVTAAGVVTTLAGSPGSEGSVDGTGSSARFNYPSGIAVDATGTVYIADSDNNMIRKMTTGGVVTTLAGVAPSVGSNDGTGGAAQFNQPEDVATDGAGNVYVADTQNNTIRKMTPGGMVTTLAGLAGNPGSADGSGSNARFCGPQGVAADAVGNVYVADSGNQTIRKITPEGLVTTLAGSPGLTGSADGSGSEARFNIPNNVGVDAAGNVYVADSNNYTIRKISPDGTVSTLAGSPGVGGYSNDTGSNARFGYLARIAVDDAGNIYVTEAFTNGIRKVTPGGVVTAFAGSIALGSSDGTASSARFDYPTGLAADRFGNIYVADRDNHTIRKITADGVVTTLAGLTGVAGDRDGSGSHASFNMIVGIAVDSGGNLYVVDFDDNVVRKGVLRHTCDFNGDGLADLIWENSATGEHGIWLMNGSAVVNWAGLPTIPTNWHIVGIGDFNGNGQADIVWANTTTGERGIWLMNGSAVINWAGLPTEPTAWRIVGTGDFNGDGEADIVWENSSTGESGIWLMNGSAVMNWAGLPTVPTAWRIVSTGDFNGDGQTDIVWENTVTGERGIWLMNGSAVVNWAGLPTEPTNWHIAR
jgi:sugar lactone lactonase YvrE